MWLLHEMSSYIFLLRLILLCTASLLCGPKSKCEDIIFGSMLTHADHIYWPPQHEFSGEVGFKHFSEDFLITETLIKFPSCEFYDE